MEKKKLKFFKKLLLKKKKELENRLAGLEEKLKNSQQEASSDLSAYPIHVADIGTDAELREEESILIESVVKELSRVNKALTKIYSHTCPTDGRRAYGICEKCKSEIPDSRLKLIPHSEFCIKCLQKVKK
ncbi:TraR/DksA C4-type zinc finger protein [candidate division WOR-3 bacterium]|nr:TraR/DksA C4-type zinc finger protein [candidate division WOR-3 bacterium]